MSKNICFIEGFLGKDPDYKVIGNGSPVCNFSIATTETFKKDGEAKEITDWTRIVCWGSLATWANENLKKGSPCTVIGKIKTRSWDKDGVKQYCTEVVADVILEVAKKDKPAQQQQAPMPESDLPF